MSGIWLLTRVAVLMILLAAPNIIVLSYVGEEPVNTFEPVMEFKDKTVAAFVEFSRDGDYALLWQSKAIYIADNIAVKVLGEVLRIRGYEAINDLDYGSGRAVLALSNMSVAMIEPLERKVLWVEKVSPRFSIFRISFNLEEDRVFAFDSTNLYLIDAASGDVLKTFNSPYRLGMLEGGSGEFVVATIVDNRPHSRYSNKLVAIDLAEERLAWLVELPSKVYSLSWSPDGRRIAAGSSSGVLYIIDRLEGRIVYELDLTQPILDTVYGGQDVLFALLANGTVVEVDPVKGELLGALGHKFRGGSPDNGVLSPRGTVYYTTRGTLVFEAYKLYTVDMLGTIDIVGANGTSVRGMVFKVSGDGGQAVIRAGDRDSIRLYATPGEYTVSYRYENVPHRMFFLPNQDLRDPPSGTVSVKVESGRESTVVVKTVYSEFALLHVLAPPGYYFLVKQDWAKSVLFEIGDSGEYYLLLTPGRYNVSLQERPVGPAVDTREVLLKKGLVTTVTLTPAKPPEDNRDTITPQPSDRPSPGADTPVSSGENPYEHETRENLETPHRTQEAVYEEEHTRADTITVSTVAEKGEADTGGVSFEKLWRIAVLVLLAVIALSLAVIAMRIRR